MFYFNLKKAITLLTCSAICTCIYTFIFKQSNLDLHNVSDNRQRINAIGQRIHQGAFTSNITNRATIRTTISTEVTFKLKQNDKYNWSYTSQLNKDYGQFAPAMNLTEYTMYVNLIETFKNACEAFNITYLLEGGSVLGAFRYHGFVPWDDDFDCKVNVSQKHILKKALDDIPGHTLLARNNTQWKFFSKNFAFAGPYSWDWPFIDIFSSRRMKPMFLTSAVRRQGISTPERTFCRWKEEYLKTW